LPPLLDVELLSLFPEIFDSFLRTSLVGKAIENGIVRVACTNPRDFAPAAATAKSTIPPMVVVQAWSCVPVPGGGHRIGRGGAWPRPSGLLSPAGRLFDQALAQDLAGRGD
jgi:tRNA (guanine37-N1)-methyltransferase